MDLREKTAENYIFARQSSYPSEKEGDSLIKAGLKLSHLRLISAISDHGQVSAAAEAMTEVENAAPNCTLLIDSRQRTMPTEPFAERPFSAGAAFIPSIESG